MAGGAVSERADASDASCDGRKTWDSLVIRKVIERGVRAREKCSGYMK